MNCNRGESTPQGFEIVHRRDSSPGAAMEKEEERKGGEGTEANGEEERKGDDVTEARGEEEEKNPAAPPVAGENTATALTLVVVSPANGNEDKVYPSPLLPHHELVADATLFGETLRRFHSVMGTKFMVPVIGGKELDLHVLYVEVTQRGGLEKVTTERRWREVIAVFRFPPTTTSASFVLRKYYINLLHHFEQVHFHGREGPLVPPPASLHSKSSSPCSNEQHLEKNRSRKRVLSSLQGQGSTSFTVTGTIDGKFEHGYLVTVNLGPEILRGVLYHAPPSGPPAGLRRRRKGWRSRDPAHPKPNRSAYNFFFADKHSKLKTLFPHREREFSKMIGESWSKLTDEERMVYQDCGLKDKERYTREMQEYRERSKLSAAQCASLQI